MKFAAAIARGSALACLAVALAGCQSSFEQVQAARKMVGDAPVVLLSASWCGYCKKLRADFKRWGVSYAEFDIEQDDAGQRAYHALHGGGIPITLIGMHRVDGYAPDHIHKLINIATAGDDITTASGD